VESRISRWSLSHRPHVKESPTPVTLAVSNEPNGMQTTKVSTLWQPQLEMGEGKSDRVKATEPSMKLRHFASK